MWKWFKERSTSEKLMLALIVMFIIGIVIRWEYVKKEAGDAFLWRIKRTEKTE